MLHHGNHSKDGSNRRSSAQGESSLEKIRRDAPRFGNKKDIEWTNIIYPYKDVVEKNIAWVTERPSFADELLTFLQTGVNLMEQVETIVEEYESASKKLKEFEGKAKDDKGSGNRDSVKQAFDFADRDLKAIRAAVHAEYQDNNLKDGILYGFGRHMLSDQKGPEARLLKQFYKYMYGFLVEAKHFDAVGKAAAELRRACEVQKAMRDAAHSRFEDGLTLRRKLKELKNKMQAVNNNASGVMDQLHGIESELEQIDQEACRMKRDVNSRHKELEKALGASKRLWKKRHPEQDQEKSKSISMTEKIMTMIKRRSGGSKESSTHTSSVSSMRDSS